MFFISGIISIQSKLGLLDTTLAAVSGGPEHSPPFVLLDTSGKYEEQKGVSVHLVSAWNLVSCHLIDGKGERV